MDLATRWGFRGGMQHHPTLCPFAFALRDDPSRHRRRHVDDPPLVGVQGRGLLRGPRAPHLGGEGAPPGCARPGRGPLGNPPSRPAASGEPRRRRTSGGGRARGPSWARPRRPCRGRSRDPRCSRRKVTASGSSSRVAWSVEACLGAQGGHHSSQRHLQVVVQVLLVVSVRDPSEATSSTAGTAAGRLGVGLGASGCWGRWERP